MHLLSFHRRIVSAGLLLMVIDWIFENCYNLSKRRMQKVTTNQQKRQPLFESYLPWFNFVIRLIIVNDGIIVVGVDSEIRRLILQIQWRSSAEAKDSQSKAS